MTDQPDRTGGDGITVSLCESLADIGIDISEPDLRKFEAALFHRALNIARRATRDAAEGAGEPLSLGKRPVAFRVRRAEMNGLVLSNTDWRLFNNEDEARTEAFALMTDYQGLYVRDSTPLVAPPKPAPDAMRDAARYRRLQIIGCAPDGTTHLEMRTVLRFSNLDAFLDEDMAAHPSRGDVPFAAPVPLPNGAGEHGIQCNLCGETLHDNEICDDAECPIGGSFTVHQSGTGATEPVATPQQVQEACAQVADRASIQDEEYARKYPDESDKFIQRAHRANTIAASIRALIPPVATPPVRGDRQP